MNKRVQIDNKLVPVSKLWIASDQRRQYEGIVFAPGYDNPALYNLWQGFSVPPREGDCSRFLDHVRTNICQGSEELFRWVIAWCAQIVQHPDEKTGTSLVLIGAQGTGKTIFGQVLGSLFEDHYFPVAEPRYITGHFNSHMVGCLLLQADEAFWAGDRTAEGRIKDLITGSWHPVEFKYVEPIKVANHIRLLVTSNNDWAVPAGVQERRFAVLRVGDQRRRDTGYFGALLKQMANGGRESLLHHLLHFDLSRVDLRQVPHTEELLEQQIQGLSPEESWWFDTLQRGKIRARRDTENRTYCKDDVFNDYISHAGKVGVRRRSSEALLGKFLHKFVPTLKSERNRIFTFIKDDGETGEERRWGYVFSTLETCRQTFEQKLGQKVQWGDDERYWDH